ncbi:MAG: IS110 family transposase [Gammaproteobacteria bacterium]|jgi:transposase
MKLYSGIDLHSNNHVLTIIDEQDQKLLERRLPNQLEATLQCLTPYQQDITGIAVESTYNWYWLVDGLMEAGYKLHLVNTTAVDQYSGMKLTNDQHDAFHLAHLMRLGILPTGYIYPKAQRAVRDLLRKRGMLVRQQTAHTLSAMSLHTRMTGRKASSNVIQRPHAESIYLPSLEDTNRQLEMKANRRMIQALHEQIVEIEKVVMKQMKLAPEFVGLKQVPGIGDILALTIALETGDIHRFANAGHYASYCRAVRSARESNGKKKGENNRKNGNKYLGWAFVEAANHMVRFSDTGKRFFQRNRAVAVKATANKLAKACFYIMRDGVTYDAKRLFH